MRSSSLTLVDIASNSDLTRGDNCNNDLLLFYEINAIKTDSKRFIYY